MFGHPIPNDKHDRVIAVRLTPAAVLVDYDVEVNQITAALEMPREEIAKLTNAADFFQAYLDFQAVALADRLVAKLDGDDLPFECTNTRYDPEKNVYHFRFRAPWTPKADVNHEFSINEGNYYDDNHSRLELTLAADEALSVEKLTAPSKALIDAPPDRRPSYAFERLRNASAEFVLPAGAPATETIEPNGPAETKQSSGLDSLWKLLIDTKQGIFLLLLLAAGFGAVHALTPGHGKTLVAAYLVGERGTVWHALLLGATTTITHTAAVLIIAAVLALFFPYAAPADVQRPLGFAGGFLVAGLGLWLLYRRLTGGVDHIHIGGGHHHHHGGHHHHHHHQEAPAAAESSVSKVSFSSLIVLGVGGGIVPCGEAFMLLALAIKANRLWLGLPLLLAFSAGLAGVLVAIGIGVVYARKFAVGRWGGGERFAGVFRTLPVVSAVLISAIGLWLCYDSLHGGQ